MTQQTSSFSPEAVTGTVDRAVKVLRAAKRLREEHERRKFEPTFGAWDYAFDELMDAVEEWERG